MAMTKREQRAKSQIMGILGKQGYPTYARLLQLFDLHLTKDPDVIAYMISNKAIIVINEGLDIEQVSTVVRHEILHEYLSHQLRMERHLNGKPENHTQVNIAGDYEISNRGYTEKDKQIARSIVLNGKILSGLVTEDQHPDWVNLSYEEMYDRLASEMSQEEQEMSDALDNQNPDSEIQQAEEVARQAEAAQEQAEEAQGQQSSSKGYSQSPDGDETVNDKTDSNDSASGVGEDSDNSGDTSSDSKSNNEDSKGYNADPNGDATIKGKVPATIIKQISKAKIDANKAAEDASELEKDAQQKGEIFDTRETRAAKEDIQARIEKIKDLLNSPAMKDAITGEATAARVREKERIAQANAARYENSSIQRFKYSLNKFIKNELAFTREGTWKKFNKTYANSPIIRRGLASMESQNKPSINVYFDHSGSWDAQKIKVGMDAIGILNNYVRRGEILIRIYYFGNQVSENPNDTGGGTEGTPILEHIQQTRPKNVIIMTDADINDCVYTVKVPGAVWFLFKGGVSENIMSAVKGMRQNQAFYL